MKNERDMRKKALRNAGKHMLVSIAVGEADSNDERPEKGALLAQNDMVSAETKNARELLNSAEVSPRVNQDGSLETPEQRELREALEERKKKFKFVPDEE